MPLKYPGCFYAYCAFFAAMDFHVIHFDYDSQITAVNSSKIQSKEDVLKPGERCTVPFETEDLLEDGRTKYRDVLYEGTVICLNLVKKKAVELARKAQKDLDSGMSLLSIINKLQDQGKKRDSAAKLAEAIENLNEEEPKAKKVKKSDTEDKVKGSKKSKKTKPEKNTDPPSTSKAKRSAIHPQKLAEISALLGDEEEFAVSQICLASKPNNFSSEACRLTEKEQVSLPSSSLSTTLSTDSGPTTPQKMLINLETPRRSPRLSASKGETTRRITNPQAESRGACYVSTPSAPNSTGTKRPLPTDSGPKTPKKLLANLETPHRSPLLSSSTAHPLSQLETRGESLSTSVRVNTTPKKMLLNLEPQRKSPRPSAYKGENPRRIIYPQTESRVAYYESTPSGPNSASTQRSLLYEDETPPVCDESQWDGTFVNSFNVLDWNERERDSTPICSQSSDFGASTSFRSFSEQQDNGPTLPVHHQSQQAHDLCVLLGITPREAAIASKVLQRMSFILSDAHDSTYEGDNGLGSSLYCTPERMSSFRTEIESSPLISKNMGLLIKDPSDPEKFKNVIVDKPKERELKLKAAVSKKPTHTMLNGLLELVFTRKELSTSSGLGLRRKTEKPSAGQGFNGQPLDPVKVSAIKEYLRYHCEQNNWTNMTTAEFNTTVTNKITNSRRLAARHPILKQQSH